MTLLPCTTIPGELILEQPNHRAADIARALGARKFRRLGKVRYYFNPRQAAQFSALYEAGFWAVRRGASVSFRRDPRPLHLYDALAVCRGLAVNNGLTVNTTRPQTEPIHQD